MNPQVKRLMMVVVAMFASLMVALTYVQFFAADNLRADARNARGIYNSYGKNRGPIVVADAPIASSKAVGDNGKTLYQRVYTANDGLYTTATGYYSVTLASTGLEKQMNSQLLGEAPSQLSSRLRQLVTGKASAGGGIELTLDPDIQKAAFDGLAGRRGAAVAIEPRTGAILALVSSPSYDPNPLANNDTAAAQKAYDALNADPNKPLDNRAYGGHLYSPGSTFKIVTAAAMLTSGDYDTDTVVNGQADLPLPGSTATLPNYNRGACGDGKPTLKYAFTMSCNTPFAQAAMDMGEEPLQQMAQAFGFNTSQTIPLTVTTSRYPTEDMQPAQLAMTAIGQYDVQATPLQMAMVAQTVANDGVQMQPYLVAEELDENLNTTRVTRARELGTPISSDVAAKLTDMMVSVAQNGDGAYAAIPGVQVAAKTGTAEVGDTGISNGWFVAFAPADDPVIAIAVVVEGGQNGVDSANGGANAGPIAKAMIQAAVAQ